MWGGDTGKHEPPDPGGKRLRADISDQISPGESARVALKHTRLSADQPTPDYSSGTFSLGVYSDHEVAGPTRHAHGEGTSAEGESGRAEVSPTPESASSGGQASWEMLGAGGRPALPIAMTPDAVGEYQTGGVRRQVPSAQERMSGLPISNR